MMSDISLLYSGAVSPLVVPRTTDSVILAGRESCPLLFPHKVAEVSPRDPVWGGHQSGQLPQLWLGEGQFTWGDGRARGRECWSGHLAAHRNAPTSEEGKGHFSQGVDGFMREAGWAGCPSVLDLGRRKRTQALLPTPRSWLIFLGSLPPHAAGKPSIRSGSPQHPLPAPLLGPCPIPPCVQSA